MINFKEVGMSKQIGKQAEEKPLSDQEKAESMNKRDKVKDEELAKNLLENVAEFYNQAEDIKATGKNPLAPKLSLPNPLKSTQELIERGLQDVNFILNSLNLDNESKARKDAERLKEKLEKIINDIK